MRNHIDLNRDIVHGRANGRVLWQPRIQCWYYDRMYRHEPLPAPYTGLDLRGLYEALGCSNRIYDYNEAVRVIEDPSVRTYEKQIDELRTQCFIETAAGTIDCVVRKNSSNYGTYCEKWWVETQKDLEVQMFIEPRPFSPHLA